MTIPVCPDCEGAGTVYAIVRAPHARMVSPCEMEGKVECETCSGSGRYQPECPDCGADLAEDATCDNCTVYDAAGDRLPQHGEDDE